jgi:hypothetical protein
MTMTTWFRTGCAVCVCLGSALWAAQGHAAVVADPATATFTSPEQSATIALTRDGAPVPAKDIRGWRFMASEHDYKHMLSLEKTDGAVKIAPSKTMEAGSYDLNIDTAGGMVVVQVFAPLSDVPDAVQKRAAITGESETRIKERLGLSVSISREETQMELPRVYYEGQTLELTMPSNPANTSAWFVNGNLVAEGPGQNAVAHTFTEPGEYVLTYLETRTDGANSAVVARATAHTRVVPVPVVQMEAAVNTETEFAPPPGYRKHAWRVDGKDVSTGQTLKATFRESGAHSVECMATAPEKGHEQGFLRLRYNITVKTV